jgi:hypothetical protein
MLYKFTLSVRKTGRFFGLSDRLMAAWADVCLACDFAAGYDAHLSQTAPKCLGNEVDRGQHFQVPIRFDTDVRTPCQGRIRAWIGRGRIAQKDAIGAG